MASSPVLQAAKQLEFAKDALTSQEVRYVESRMLGSPPVIAARSAGYLAPIESATSLERDQRIQDAMRATTRLATRGQRLTRDDVLAGFMDAVGMAATATEVIAAWREIGRVIGAYEPSKIDITVTHQQQLKEMDDKELAQLASIEGDYEVLTFEPE